MIGEHGDRNRLRVSFLTLYGAHEQVQQPLEALADHAVVHAAEVRALNIEDAAAESAEGVLTGWEAEYLAALRATARTTELYRLGPDEPLAAGERIIHAWVCYRLSGHPWPLASCYVTAGFLVGEPIEHWDPLAGEPRTAATRRLEAQMRDRIAGLARENGRREAAAAAMGWAPVRAKKAARDLEWLCRKLLGESFGDIADSDIADRERVEARPLVQRAVVRMARRIGLDTNGWADLVTTTR